MASGTKIRLFTKLLDAADAPLWVISPSGRLAYLSAGCSSWLGVDVNSLVDRQAIAGAPVSDDLLDRIAASLSAPPGLDMRGTASLKVQPPAGDEHRPESIEVRFVRVGNDSSAITVAAGGKYLDREIDFELQDAVAIRSDWMLGGNSIQRWQPSRRWVNRNRLARCAAAWLLRPRHEPTSR